MLTGGLQLSGAYRFRSVTFKALERRADGVFEPTGQAAPVHVVEFQAQPAAGAWYNLLTKVGLIEKVGLQGNKKGATYRATEKGIQATDLYAKYRQQLLIPLTQAISDSDDKMDQVAKVLSLLSGIYDQAACVAATHRDT